MRFRRRRAIGTEELVRALRSGEQEFKAEEKEEEDAPPGWQRPLEDRALTLKVDEERWLQIAYEFVTWGAGYAQENL